MVSIGWIIAGVIVFAAIVTAVQILLDHLRIRSQVKRDKREGK